MTEPLATFWDHLQELRQTLIKVVLVILIGTGLAFIFSEFILQFLTQPLQNRVPFHQTNLKTYDVKTIRMVNTGNDSIIFELPKDAALKEADPKAKFIDKEKILLSPKAYVDWEQIQPLHNLLILNPIEGFIVALKISFWLGLAVTSPCWLYFIFQFIAPALHQREKQLILPFVFLSFLFITLGISFAYFIMIPIANQYFFSFNENLGLNFWSFSNYIDYTFLLLLSNAIAFELFVIVLLLVHYGILKAQIMKEKRRHVIVAVFILAAILTPSPDALSQLLMAIPMLILYELTICYALIKKRPLKQGVCKSMA